MLCFAVGLCILGAAWRWTSLSEWLDVSTVAASLKSIRNRPFAPWIVLAVYVVASQIMFPITLLILATAYAFGPWLGFVYGLVGSVVGALVTYFIGCWLGTETYNRVTRSRFDAIATVLREKGLAAVITTHLLPVGPFTFVNLASGVVRVGVWQFILGCTIGMLPGIALTTFFEHQLESTVHNPGILTGGLFAVSAALIVASVLWARHWARTKPG